MRPTFHPQLVNGPFGDPGVYIDCLFQKRAILFDLGDLHRLPSRKILRISDVFVSHTHMDHFIGFDWIVRICLGRQTTLSLFGPPRFIDQVQSKLAAYTWNLVHNYASDFLIVVTEIHPEGWAKRARFSCQRAFHREEMGEFKVQDGVVADGPEFRVRCVFIDHGIPCLAYALEEKDHLNVWKNRLQELGLKPGPWLQDLKGAVLTRQPDHTVITVGRRSREAGHEGPMQWPLGYLREAVLRIVPGQKISYVTDAGYHRENVERIVQLVRGSDVLFIESAFLEEDAVKAAAKQHLTAHQAGTIARLAGVANVMPFHFSPAYWGRESHLREELENARSGIPSAPT